MRLHPAACPGVEPATEQADNAGASGLAILRLTVPTPCGSFSAASVITALVLYSHDRYLKHPIISSIYSITDFPHGGPGLPFLLTVSPGSRPVAGVEQGSK